MAGSRLFYRLMYSIRLALYAEREGLSGKETLARLEEDKERRRLSRRDFVGAVAATGALAAMPSAVRAAAHSLSTPRIAIVGAGLAGLACADRLRERGVSAVLYEANPDRVGGRCFSTLSFPGQAAEIGGELIDTGHHTMRHYANEFNLPLEDYSRNPGETFYLVNGQLYSEAEVVDELRVLIGRMRPDLRLISSAPDAFTHSADDVAFDQMSLAEYLATRAGDLPVVSSVIEHAYIGEYGRETADQPSLNFLLYIRGDRRSRFEPFGGSDERFHVRVGNERIAEAIASRLPGTLNMGAALTRIRKTLTDQFALSFGSSSEELFDAVVIAIPFTVLRTLDLDASLGLSADKLRAINQLGYGWNSKTMVGFNRRPWSVLGGTGESYADLASIQNTWETNWSDAVDHAVLTNFCGGELSRRLQTGPQDDAAIQAQVASFLADLDRIFPGASAAATRISGRYRVEVGHWLTNPYSLGSYTCYQPGQFTGIAGLESQSSGLLKFAGEHTDSFYSYQGFMEGALLSGIRAANELLDDMRAGRL